MTTITNETLVATFDRISTSIEVLLSKQLEKKRITGAEYTQALIQLTNSSLQISTQYALSYEVANKQMELLEKQAKQVEQETILKEKQASVIDEELKQMQEIDLQIKQAQKTSIDSDNSLKEEQLSQMKDVDKQIKQAQKTGIDKDNTLKEKQASVIDEELNIKKEQLNIAKEEVKLKKAQTDIAQEELKLSQEKIEQLKGIDKQLKEAQKIHIRWQGQYVSQQYHSEILNVVSHIKNQYIIDESGFNVGVHYPDGDMPTIPNEENPEQGNNVNLNKDNNIKTASEYGVSSTDKTDQETIAGWGILGKNILLANAKITEAKLNNALITQKIATEEKYTSDHTKTKAILDDDGFPIGLSNVEASEDIEDNGGITGSQISLNKQNAKSLEASTRLKFCKLFTDVASVTMSNVSGVEVGYYGFNYDTCFNQLNAMSEYIYPDKTGDNSLVTRNTNEDDTPPKVPKS